SRTALVASPETVTRNFPPSMNFQSFKPAGGGLKLRLVLSNPLATSQTANLPWRSLFTSHRESEEKPMTPLVGSPDKRRVSLRVRASQRAPPPLTSTARMDRLSGANCAVR